MAILYDEYWNIFESKEAVLVCFYANTRTKRQGTKENKSIAWRFKIKKINVWRLLAYSSEIIDLSIFSKLLFIIIVFLQT